MSGTKRHGARNGRIFFSPPGGRQRRQNNEQKKPGEKKGRRTVRTTIENKVELVRGQGRTSLNEKIPKKKKI